MRLSIKILGLAAIPAILPIQAKAELVSTPESRFMGYTIARADVSNLISTMSKGGWFDQSGTIYAFGGNQFYSARFGASNVTLLTGPRKVQVSSSVRVKIKLDFTAFSVNFDKTYNIALTARSNVINETNGAFRLQVCPESWTNSGSGIVDTEAQSAINDAISKMPCTDVASFADIFPNLSAQDVETGPTQVWETEAIKFGYTIKDLKIPSKPKYNSLSPIYSLLLD
jgi:hypothetical protein